jgi:DNA polymerase III epsilon subunit-like protein
MSIKKTLIEKDLSLPKYYRRAMVFDTETSGLIPKRAPGGAYPPDEAYPYILQLSWIVYNVSTNVIEDVVNEYINVSDKVEISEDASRINGITREILESKGKPILFMLKKFYSAYMMCDCIVAHNMHFDGEVVRKEMWRNREELKKNVGIERANMMCGIFTKKFNNAYHIDLFCTMMSTIDFCNIQFATAIKPIESEVQDDIAKESENSDIWKVGKEAEAFIGENWVRVKVVKINKTTIRVEINDTHNCVAIKPTNSSIRPLSNSDCLTTTTPENVTPKQPRKKFPRLNELYCKLFETSQLPNDLHNSIVDVLVCLRCFLKVRSAKEMEETDFQEMVDKYSR